ncbi:hypothetical protein CC2G_006827 [Coprinopsis cinerea AmutBmut pab1-1]|nr:hypothetical protein CC2G_006827 [Coprinopsis cinerea AmutBmut pab1-1]
MFGALHEFLSFRMAGVDDLVARRIKDIEASTSAANQAFQEKVNHRIEEIEILASGSVSRKRRIKRGQPADILANHPLRVQFAERIRSFFDDHLLKVDARVAILSAAETSNMVKSKLGRALLQFRPLTEEEWQAYEDNAPSAIKVDANNFRLDFSRSRRAEFNREALHVAAEAFIEAAHSGYLWGDTTSPAIPSELLKYEVVAYAIDNHAEYLWSVYSEATRDDSVAREKARLTRASRTSRKASLHAHRLDTALADPEYRRFAPLIKRIGVQGMSDDETDDEDPDSFIRVSLPWRAERLTQILWALDERYEEHLRSSVGKTNRRRGPLPRARRLSQKVNLKAVPPRKLPKNLYNSDWLQLLKPHQRKRVAPEDATYNFQTGKVVKKKNAQT